MIRLKIDWNEFFFHRVTFGMYVMRRIQKQKGVEVKREYLYRWRWKFNGIPGYGNPPWHRCWVYDDLWIAYCTKLKQIGKSFLLRI